MGKLNEFFSMTRRERVGAFCVLVIIALIIFIMALVHTCVSRPSPQVRVDVSLFEQETDSAVHVKPAKHKKSKMEKRKSSKKNNKSESKQRRSDRDVEPVPTF